jgi:uncharacterized membrane protein YccC
MGSTSSDTGPTGPSQEDRGLRPWWVRHDPGLRATKRSVRAAVLVPVIFALSKYGTANNQTPLFAVFGSVSLLLFVDFGGPLRIRVRSYVVLWLVGAVFVTVGTLCSTTSVAAVATMAVVAFGVLFAGVVSPQAVAASTAVLLLFVLPVSEQAPASAVGDRLLGWALAGVLCIPAALFVWAGRWHDPLRHTLADASRSIAELLDAAAQGAALPTDHTAVDRALVGLRKQYEATPYRPTGAGPSDVALTNLVSRLEWAGSRALAASSQSTPPDERAGVTMLERAAADVLRTVGDLVEARDPAERPDLAATLRQDVTRLAEARQAVTDVALAALAADAGVPTLVDVSTDPSSALEQVDPTYPARMLAFALELLATGALDVLGPASDAAGWWARGTATLRSFARVAAGHLTMRSVWLRNSLRGAIGLSLAVVVIEVTTVQHGFWVVLGTLSVLRSNALGTGATAVRAVLGTAIGFLGGYVVLLALGHHDARLWVVLPLAVLVAGITPTVSSFTAGQAGFTVLVVVVFNIIEPVGSKVGLIRIEDVLIGALVSVVVGLLFWPRGAGAELARALGDAYATAAAWLSAAVDQVARNMSDTDPDWGSGGSTALASAQRLDDAYRQYLGERGAKSVPLPDITRLLTGTARIRLTALTLEALPDLAVPGGPPPLPEVVSARDTVTSECTVVESWFARLTASFARRGTPLPDPQPIDVRLAPELVAAWDAVRREGRRDGVLAVLRLLWVEERMADLRRLQGDLATTAIERSGRTGRLRGTGRTAPSVPSVDTGPS